MTTVPYLADCCITIKLGGLALPYFEADRGFAQHCHRIGVLALPYFEADGGFAQQRK